MTAGALECAVEAGGHALTCAPFGQGAPQRSGAMQAFAAAPCDRLVLLRLEKCEKTEARCRVIGDLQGMNKRCIRHALATPRLLPAVPKGILQDICGLSGYVSRAPYVQTLARHYVTGRATP